MTSEISSRAACLAELTSNPKSFYNCPDLQGGPGLPEGRFNSETLKSGKLKATLRSRWFAECSSNFRLPQSGIARP
jgi:hypothetical protein